MGTAELPDRVKCMYDADREHLCGLQDEAVNRVIIELDHRRQQVEDLLLIADKLADDLKKAGG